MRLAPSLAALLLLVPLTACQPSTPAGDNAAGSGSTSSASQAEKTKELQQKAADLDRRAEELKNNTSLSDQEKIDTANQIDKERQELARQSESNH